LRSEIDRRTNVQWNVIALQITSPGVIASLAISRVTDIALLLVIPLLSYMLGTSRRWVTATGGNMLHPTPELRFSVDVRGKTTAVIGVYVQVCRQLGDHFPRLNPALGFGALDAQR
jgi:uncharacterized membrane protein YhfC